MLKIKVALAALALTAASTQAYAGISVMVGDVDGYGYGRPDVSTGVAWPGPGGSGENYDGRDAAEMAATNGAQITDDYSAIFPGFGPNGSETADVLFPFSGTLKAAKITIAMGDFQSSTFGPIAASINGSPISMAFDDGFRNSTIRSFSLDAAALAAANAAQEVVLHLDHTGSSDFIAFDWFQLNAVPEPGVWTMLILGMGAIGGALRRKAALA